MISRAARPVGSARDLVVAGAFAVAVLAGCGGSISSKAGDRAGSRQTTVLTMLTTDAPQADRMVFADAVRRLSHGTLRIRIEQQEGSGTTSDGERRARERVERGDAAMAWLASRAWASDGVASFRALWAPFVITSHALLWKVVTSPLAEKMLRGTEARGVIGLTLVPSDLRRILGRGRPLVSLAAFRGARVAAYSQAEAEALRALGAIPRLDEADLPVSLREGRVDGLEVGGYNLVNNPWVAVAPYVSANVVLFPRTDVIAINKRAFDRLTPEQRSALREAGRLALEAQRDLADQETEILQAVCSLGGKLVRATRVQLAQLVEAERPVNDRLARDPAVRPYLEQIEAMKRQTPPEPPLKIPAGCSG
jgi:TRAP-type C4-dicarboxylate transport system substrate-binding protein